MDKKMSHTPGTWFVIKHPEYGNAKYRVDVNPDAPWGNFGEICFVDGESNAHLISASPDLLEALESLINALDDLPPIQGKKVLKAYLNAKKVLKRAKGEL